MTEDKEILINSLKDKVKSIIAIYERTNAEKEQLIREKNELQKLNELKDDEIKKLEQKYSNLKLASAMVSGEHKHETKIKLNRIMREIDRCIALLNKLN